MTQPVVTQADRELAADHTPSRSTAAMMRIGTADRHPHVKAFARHRTSAVAELVEALDELVELFGKREVKISSWELLPKEEQPMHPVRQAMVLIASHKGEQS